MNEYLWVFLAFVIVLILIAGMRSAYYNGAVDGYGFSKEPNNPGYQKAGRHLKKYMTHRWTELRS